MENTTNYEMTFVIGADVQEFDVQKLVTKIQDAITARGGHVITSDMWGKQRLAYPIGKHEFGYYQTFVFSHPGDTIAEFEKEVRIMPEMIRHLIISLDKENLRPEQLKHLEPFKDQAEYRASKIAASEARTQRSSSPRPAAPAPQVSDKDEATRLKELDEKLSGLLSEEEAPKDTAPAEVAPEVAPEETKEEPKEE